MKELALARGFYPIVAIGPDYDSGRSHKGAGKGSSKGKGTSSKGKGSKGKGKGKPFFPRRLMHGLRKPTTSTSTGSSESRSTLSGSTSQHGPRFKRYRVQSQGVKELGGEEVTIAEDQEAEECLQEENYFATLTPGHAIVDSGATRTLVGEEVWKEWVEKYNPKILGPMTTNALRRSFEFGGGETLESSYEINFNALVKGQRLPVTVSIVPGNTPFLLARPLLEKWEVKQDYATGSMKVAQSEWFNPSRGKKGHYVLNLLDYESAEQNDPMLFVLEEEPEIVLSHFKIEPVMGKEPMDVHELIFTIRVKTEGKEPTYTVRREPFRSVIL